jgi:hypothetical protein
MPDVYQLRQDSRGGVVLSSACCGFIAETGRRDDAEFIRDSLASRPRGQGVCPSCGKCREFRP